MYNQATRLVLLPMLIMPIAHYTRIFNAYSIFYYSFIIFKKNNYTKI